MKKFSSASLLFLFLAMTGIAQTEGRIYDKIVKQADLVFSGTVARQHCFLRSDSMLVTETVFNDVEVVKSVNPAREKTDTLIRIVYAGGSLNGKIVLFPDIPELVTGKRYFIFVKDDGVFHANPFPGGCHAAIEIFRDTVTGCESISRVSACRSVALSK